MIVGDINFSFLYRFAIFCEASWALLLPIFSRSMREPSLSAVLGEIVLSISPNVRLMPQPYTRRLQIRHSWSAAMASLRAIPATPGELPTRAAMPFVGLMEEQKHLIGDVSLLQLPNGFCHRLALTAQLPYETKDGPTNMMSLMLAVGSPMLVTYSLCITILNSRWLNERFAFLRDENNKLGKHQIPAIAAAGYLL